jgi:hypothetical protein
MPSQEGIKKLLHKKSQKEIDWLEMLEERRKLVKPYLKELSLNTMSERIYLNGGRSENTTVHQLKEDRPAIVTSSNLGLTLETRGMFFPAFKPLKENIYTREPLEEEVYTWWGISLYGDWLLINVRYDFRSQDPSYEVAFQVDIAKREDLSILVKSPGINPKEMWFSIGKLIMEWKQKREFLYRRASNLLATVKSEEQIVNIIPE